MPTQHGVALFGAACGVSTDQFDAFVSDELDFEFGGAPHLPQSGTQTEANSSWTCRVTLRDWRSRCLLAAWDADAADADRDQARRHDQA
jgi:hypothetical protein